MVLRLTLEAFKANWKRYVWSSVVTFFTFFLADLLFVIKDLTWESLLTASWVGAALVIARLVGKALFESIKKMLVWILERMKEDKNVAQ